MSVSNPLPVVSFGSSTTLAMESKVDSLKDVLEEVLVAELRRRSTYVAVSDDAIIRIAVFIAQFICKIETLECTICKKEFRHKYDQWLTCCWLCWYLRNILEGGGPCPLCQARNRRQAAGPGPIRPLCSPAKHPPAAKYGTPGYFNDFKTNNNT